MRTPLLGLAAVALLAAPAFATSDADVRAALEQRLQGDRTGACVAAAVLDNATVATAYVCADAKSPRPYDERTAFEIGSVTKTMNAALLAEFIARGEIALGDPIAKVLPAGTSVPSFEGRQITIADIVTHTSGLPTVSPRWNMDMSNPYARLTERDLLGALAATQLTRAPGSHWEYSNFATMVLSYALSRRTGTDYETLLRERLLAPLGMNDTFIAKRPPHIRVAQGHLSNALPTGPWDIPVDMAGAGGVRATLSDMVRYLEGQLGLREVSITPALAQTQQQVARVDGRIMGMNWFIVTANGRTLVSHEGATGGYAAYVAFERAARRGVVLLSDTALGSVGGMAALGRHLLDPSVPAGAPRRIATADARLIDALVGRYRLRDGPSMEVRRKGTALTIQADGQPEFEMGYDSVGDFYPLAFDALLRPKRNAGGAYTFTWLQLGDALEAERLGTPAPTAARWAPSEAQLAEYGGTYPLWPAFALRVFSREAKLFVQGTNQGPLEVQAVDKDIFVAESVGAEIEFQRDAGGKVVALTLKQGGQVLRGKRN